VQLVVELIHGLLDSTNEKKLYNALCEAGILIEW